MSIETNTNYFTDDLIKNGEDTSTDLTIISDLLTETKVQKINFDVTKYFTPNADSSITIDFDNDDLFHDFIKLAKLTNGISEESRDIIIKNLTNELCSTKEDTVRLTIKITFWLILWLMESSSPPSVIDGINVIKDENGKIRSVTIQSELMEKYIHM